MRVAKGLKPSSALALAWLAACFVPSVARATEVAVHGTIDVTAVGQDDAVPLNHLMSGDTMFDPWRLMLHADFSPAGQVKVFTQIVMTDATGADMRPYGAYLSWTPKLDRDFQIVAGKIPWFIGTYGPRTYSDKKPLIGTPMMWQYRTTLRSDRIPPTAGALLAAAGTGQFGPVYDAAGRGLKGMPVLYDPCWGMGAMVVGSSNAIEYSAGFTQGPPSAPAAGPDANSNKTFLGRIGIAPQPWVRAGVSAAYGAYLSRTYESALSPNQDANDFRQRVLMADLELSGSHAEFHSEAFHNVWNTPTVGDLEVWGGYLEGKYSFDFGGYLAARIECMRFGDLADGTGVKHTWDANVDRQELGVGYRFTRAVQGKLVYQRNRMDEDRVTRVAPAADVVAAQVVVRF